MCGLPHPSALGILSVGPRLNSSFLSLSHISDLFLHRMCTCSYAIVTISHSPLPSWPQSHSYTTPYPFSGTLLHHNLPLSFPGWSPAASTVLPSAASALGPPCSGGHRTVPVLGEEESQEENVREVIIMCTKHVIEGSSLVQRFCSDFRASCPN